MRYMAVAETDKGDFRETNQDSILVQHGRVGEEEILLAAVCDGMGGLARGELASAIAVRSFSRWFKQELMPGLSPADLVRMDMQEIANRWTVMLKRLNARISEYGRGTDGSPLRYLCPGHDHVSSSDRDRPAKRRDLCAGEVLESRAVRGYRTDCRPLCGAGVGEPLSELR